MKILLKIFKKLKRIHRNNEKFTADSEKRFIDFCTSYNNALIEKLSLHKK